MVITVLIEVGLNAPIVFGRRHPNGSRGVFGLCGFEAVARTQSRGNGLLPSSIELAGFNDFLHSADLSRLPRTFGVLGNSVDIVNPHPLLIGCLPLCSRRRERQRSIEPKLSK